MALRMGVIIWRSYDLDDRAQVYMRNRGIFDVWREERSNGHGQGHSPPPKYVRYTTTLLLRCRQSHFNDDTAAALEKGACVRLKAATRGDGEGGGRA